MEKRHVDSMKIRRENREKPFQENENRKRTLIGQLKI